MIWVNSENVRHLPTPFGGMKASGIGRDGGDYSFDFYMETKHVSLARGTHKIQTTGICSPSFRGAQREPGISRISGSGRLRDHPGITSTAGETACPFRPHIFDPPFNIIRCSHVVLDVTDLNASPAFYETTVGLHVEDRDDKAVYLRGSEEHQHHSLVLRKAQTAACNRLGFKVGNDGDLDKAASVLLGERHPLQVCRAAVPGPHAAVHRSLRFSDRALRLDGEAPASVAALRSLQGLPSAAARPFQRLRRRGAGHRRLLRAPRFPADRIWRGGRTERTHRRSMDASQGQCARLCHHQRQGPSPAPFCLLGADRDERPASLRRDGLQRLS